MSNQADDVVIEIAGSTGLREISAVYVRVLTALQSARNVVIDLERIDDTDITLLQLIEAARQYAAAAQKVLALKHPVRPALQAQLERGGFLSRGVDRLFWLQTAEISQ